MIARTTFPAFLLSMTAFASPAQQADPAAIETVIRDQLADFTEDDWVGAFEHASPNIRRIFGSAENFGAMVRNGYPMVWRPSEARFGKLSERTGRALQRVIVFDDAGVPHALEYEMIQVDGAWKINGVRFLQASTGA
ncbi:DUF4864 domain-containing protein [Aliiruegeria lutimaris]|uniref:DUF4864 domain-containing protein n=1 Tax=Aliiruegeria lutimaris TaxID=571298 RepID=A0A1G9H3J1_9RHOB|nr:DUF4864 domain-containing protein [Aliiruegeria lutimaris]SDL07405.1 protein of unknown function [Aliiruegeria lutimaris]